MHCHWMSSPVNTGCLSIAEAGYSIVVPVMQSVSAETNSQQLTYLHIHSCDTDPRVMSVQTHEKDTHDVYCAALDVIMSKLAVDSLAVGVNVASLVDNILSSTLAAVSLFLRPLPKIKQQQRTLPQPSTPLVPGMPVQSKRQLEQSGKPQQQTGGFQVQQGLQQEQLPTPPPQQPMPPPPPRKQQQRRPNALIPLPPQELHQVQVQLGAQAPSAAHSQPSDMVYSQPPAALDIPPRGPTARNPTSKQQDVARSAHRKSTHTLSEVGEAKAAAPKMQDGAAEDGQTLGVYATSSQPQPSAPVQLGSSNTAGEAGTRDPLVQTHAKVRFQLIGGIRVPFRAASPQGKPFPRASDFFDLLNVQLHQAVDTVAVNQQGCVPEQTRSMQIPGGGGSLGFQEADRKRQKMSGIMPSSQVNRGLGSRVEVLRVFIHFNS